MSFMWTASLLLYLLLNSVGSQSEESPFKVPSFLGNNVEYYDTQHLRHAIFLEHVYFSEAQKICSSWDGNLLELKDKVVGEFIALALAESAVGVSSLWIGGEYTPANVSSPGVWRWTSGERIIKAPIPVDQHFPMDQPPYWVDRPDLNSTERACLVTDRCMHQRPLITGLPCTVRRPFICTLAASDKITDPVETSSPIVSRTKTFHIFHAQSTWSESLSFCRNLGYKLAVITKPEEFRKLQNRMTRHRPVLENAWIGGAYVNGKWMWVSTNEEIGTKNNSNGNFSSPWFRPDHVTMDGCLLADRHVCDYFAYVEARCDRRRNIICESVVGKEGEKSTLLNVPSSNMFVSTIKLDWNEAQEVCTSCLDGGSLLQLEVHNVTSLTLVIRWLFRAMTDVVETELRHVWVGGYLFGEQFTWGKNISNPIENKHADLVLDKKTSIINDTGEDGLIMFCPGNFNTDPNLRNFKCLNMDRENQKTFFMYGLNCDHRQHFVCMAQGHKSEHTSLPQGCGLSHAFAKWRRRKSSDMH